MDFWVSAATIVAIYALLALSLNLRYGYTGLVDFSIAGFFLIGSYTSAIFTAPSQELDILGESSIVGYFHWPFLLGLFAAIVSSCLVAFLIGIVALRPKGLQGDYFAVVTIGLAEALRWVAINEHWITRGPQGIRDLPFVFRSWAPDLHREFFFLMVLTAVIIAYIGCRRLYLTGFGRALRGIREDEKVTESLGKNPYSFKVTAFIVGGVLSGIAGSFWAHFAGAIQPNEFTPELTFIVWVCVIIGGRGNNLGVILGTLLVIGIFEQATRFLPNIQDYPQALPAIRMVCIGLLLLFTLRFRPNGLLPEKLVKVDKQKRLYI